MQSTKNNNQQTEINGIFKKQKMLKGLEENLT